MDIGRTLPLRNLKPHYDAILFAYGAPHDKQLGIPGESGMRGVYSAREFVGWYNGLPEHRDLEPDLTSGEEAVVIGQGNVALDVARILLTDIDVLRKTDMADYALEKLAKSTIRRVRVVGRRGPVQVSFFFFFFSGLIFCLFVFILTIPSLRNQAAFTIKEVREMLQLPSVAFDPIPQELFPPESVISKFPRADKRLLQLLEKGSSNDPNTATKTWSLDFLLSPDSLQGSTTDPQRLSQVKFTRNILNPDNPFHRGSTITPQLAANGDQVQVDVPASALFRSVGYKSQAIGGLEDVGIQFDERRGIIPNDGFGRVTANSNDGWEVSYLPGLYCAGWVKRGPTGVIATTMMDAFSTAESVASDLANYRAQTGETSMLNAPGSSSGQGWEGVRMEAEKNGELHAVSWQDWLHIDSVERERGKQRGKLRDKFGRVEDMLGVL